MKKGGKRKGGIYKPISSNQFSSRISKMDKDTLQAYERYVFAQLRATNEEEKAQEMKAAIDSITKGTLYHMHLFFLDLAKRKKNQDMFTEEESVLFEKFKEQHGSTPEFNEIEVIYNLINQAEALPNQIDQSTSDDVIDNIISIVEFID